MLYVKYISILKRQKQNSKSWRRGKNLISRVTTLLDSNAQFSTKKIARHTKKQKCMANSKKKYNKPTETVPVKDLMGGFTRQRLQNVLKDAQRTKGSCGESQENDV